MHELSIAVSLVEMASRKAAEVGARRVLRVLLRVGPLSGVVPEALAFAFEVASAETTLEGARLEIEAVPVVVFCPSCRADHTLSDRFALSCPACGTAAPEVRSGRELELTAIEVDDCGTHPATTP